MKFKERLLQGTLVKRYKRFFVDIKYQNETITAHCPNSGRMTGCISEGWQALISRATNPNRKLKYTIELKSVYAISPLTLGSKLQKKKIMMYLKN